MLDLELYSEERIMADVRGLQYLYGLKREIRYNYQRDEEDTTESVAEHIYGMHVLALFFLPLIDENKKLNQENILKMITIHDIDEIETGDMLGYLKTDKIRAEEALAAKRVIKKSPHHLQKDLNTLLEEYEKQETIEAKFVKAIDKFEPMIHLYNEEGKIILHRNKTTEEQGVKVKESYIKPFPVIYRYYQVIHQKMVEENFFSSTN